MESFLRHRLQPVRNLVSMIRAARNLATAARVRPGIMQAEFSQGGDTAVPARPVLLALRRQGLAVRTEGATPWHWLLRSSYMTAFAAGGDFRTFYVGTDGASVWRSTDGGRQWTDTHLPTGGRGMVRVLAVSAHDPAVVYAVCRDDLYRTEDGGASWDTVTSFLHVGGVRRLAIDPWAASTLWLSTLSHGLCRSTDGGRRWVPVPLEGWPVVTSLAFAPEPAGTVYASLMRPSRAPTRPAPDRPPPPLLVADWYGHGVRTVEIASQTAVWYHSGKPPVVIRCVLIRDPQGTFDTQALLCTDPTAAPSDILQYFVRRWRMEVTYEESRAHLGIETQRQWSDKAIARTTPALFGLFSLVSLLAHRLLGDQPCPVRRAAWYAKPLPTFSDTLTLVRHYLWTQTDFRLSPAHDDSPKVPVLWWTIWRTSSVMPPELAKVEL